MFRPITSTHPHATRERDVDAPVVAPDDAPRVAGHCPAQRLMAAYLALAPPDRTEFDRAYLTLRLAMSSAAQAPRLAPRETGPRLAPPHDDTFDGLPSIADLDESSAHATPAPLSVTVPDTKDEPQRDPDAQGPLGLTDDTGHVLLRDGSATRLRLSTAKAGRARSDHFYVAAPLEGIALAELAQRRILAVNSKLRLRCGSLVHVGHVDAGGIALTLKRPAGQHLTWGDSRVLVSLGRPLAVSERGTRIHFARGPLPPGSCKAYELEKDRDAEAGLLERLRRRLPLPQASGTTRADGGHSRKRKADKAVDAIVTRRQPMLHFQSAKELQQTLWAIGPRPGCAGGHDVPLLLRVVEHGGEPCVVVRVPASSTLVPEPARRAGSDDELEVTLAFGAFSPWAIAPGVTKPTP